jgi:hypothetical protein
MKKIILLFAILACIFPACTKTKTVDITVTKTDTATVTVTKTNTVTDTSYNSDPLLGHWISIGFTANPFFTPDTLYMDSLPYQYMITTDSIFIYNGQAPA